MTDISFDFNVVDLRTYGIGSVDSHVISVVYAD